MNKINEYFTETQMNMILCDIVLKHFRLETTHKKKQIDNKKTSKTKIRYQDIMKTNQKIKKNVCHFNTK